MSRTLSFAMLVYCLFAFAPQACADHGFDWDFSTQIHIEPLIQLHKQYYKAEVEALQKITVADGLDGGIKSNATKYSDDDATISSKYDGTKSLIIAISALNDCLNLIPKLVTESAELAEVAARAAKHEPFVNKVFYSASAEVEAEIKHCYKMLANIGLQSTTIMQASADEKCTMSMRLRDSLVAARKTVEVAKCRIKSMVILPLRHYAPNTQTRQQDGQQKATELKAQWNSKTN